MTERRWFVRMTAFGQNRNASPRNVAEDACCSRRAGTGARYTVYALPSIREADEFAAHRGAVGEPDGDGPLASALVVPTGTKVEFVGAVFEAGQLYAKTIVSAAPTPQRSKDFSAMSAPSGSASFVRAGGVGCLHRKQNNTAWYETANHSR